MNKEARKLRRENNDTISFLNWKYQKIFRKIDTYIYARDIFYMDRENIRRDIINMLYEGQKRNQPVNEIIGDDYKMFCDAFLSSVDVMTKKDKIIKHLSMLVLAAAVSLLFIPFVNIFEIEHTFLMIKVYSNILILIPIFYIYILITTRFTNSFIFSKGYFFIYAILYFSYMKLTKYTAHFFIYSYFTLNFYIYLIIQIGMFLLWKYLDNKL